MLTLGKIHRIQQCVSSEGKFIMLALDHRNNLVRSFNPENPGSVPYSQLANFKKDLISVLSPVSSGVLLDPEYGVPATVPSGAIAKSAGLLVAVEKTGYTGNPLARESQVLPGWSVEKISRLGAAGVKLLIYYHPDAPNAKEQETLVQNVSEECVKYDLPFFLEPLSFSLDPEIKKLPSVEKRAVVVETARRLTPLGVDILKAEFPINTADEKNVKIWAEACEELSTVSQVPWILLSAGVEFDEFEMQTKVACMSGSSGVLAGRAVWKEAVEMTGSSRMEFLRTTATQRIQRLHKVIDDFARPWMGLQTELDENWYRNY